MSRSAPFDVDALKRWFERDARTDLTGPLTAKLIAGGRSNPTYEITDGARSFVLRRPPHGFLLPTAHDMRREYTVLAALQRTAVPVPKVLGLCTDQDVIGSSFYVMEMLDGVTLRTQADTSRLTTDQRARFAEAMVDTLVALHEIDPGEVGLGMWGRPQTYLLRQLIRWRHQWEQSITEPRSEVYELLDRLASSLPETSFPGIVHGDFKVDNVMVDRKDPTRIVGLLDWEMSTLGDTLTDLGMLCSCWDQEGELFNPITAGATGLPGFPVRTQLVERYAAARRMDVSRLDWYMVFADFKIAVILEGIHARHLQGHTVGADFEGVGVMVGLLLERALDLSVTLTGASTRG